jgi:hypothetical protein
MNDDEIEDSVSIDSILRGDLSEKLSKIFITSTPSSTGSFFTDYTNKVAEEEAVRNLKGLPLEDMPMFLSHKYPAVVELAKKRLELRK